MLQAAYSAKAAAIAQQRKLDVIANNVSNVNTYGFKSSSVTFQDLLYTQMVKPTGNEEGSNLERGTGVKPIATDYTLASGAMISTGGSLDFAITGQNAFFTVQNAYGQRVYTKNGAFNWSVEAEGQYLVSAQGYYILDDNGERIRLPDDATGDIAIDQSGNILAGSGQEPFAKLGMASFPNPLALRSVGGNMFAQTQSSGEAAAAADYTVEQGYLEGSNVDMATEMTNAIITHRAFSFATRIISIADEMEALANSMR